MEIFIERGNSADLDAMEQFYYDVTGALERGVNYPGWRKGAYPAREDAERGIESRSLYVARSGGKIAGSIIVNHAMEEAYSRAKWQYDEDGSRIFVIHTLAVHPAFTKLGIGGKLMRFAERLGEQNQIRAIRLDVYENNTPAIRLYGRCGYRYIAKVDLGPGQYGPGWFRLYEKLL